MNTQNSITYELDSLDFRTFAIVAHGQQKYANLPYSAHLAMVEHVLANSGFRGYLYEASAWLHDVVEDCNIAIELIAAKYGIPVAQIVEGCTGRGKNRKERNQDIYDKLKKFPIGAPVKVADRIANVKFGIATKSPKLKMYIDEFPEFSRNIRPLILDQKNGAVLWNNLEDAIVQGIQTLRNFGVAPVATAA